jgi:hypothetical protein
MDFPDVHDPDYWLQELRPLLDELHFAFQTALPKAVEYFEQRNRPINGPLLSNLIRYEVLEYLRSHGISAYEDDSEVLGPLDGCGMNALPNNGIELVYKGSCLRLRKGVEPPRPTTEAQRGWYQQELGLRYEDDRPVALTNLLLLWYAKGPREFAGLKLLRTEGVLENSVVCDWEIPVPGPSIALSEVIASEYREYPELPLDGSVESGALEKTGSDGH